MAELDKTLREQADRRQRVEDERDELSLLRSRTSAARGPNARSATGGAPAPPAGQPASSARTAARA